MILTCFVAIFCLPLAVFPSTFSILFLETVEDVNVVEALSRRAVDIVGRSNARSDSPLYLIVKQATGASGMLCSC